MKPLFLILLFATNLCVGQKNRETHETPLLSNNYVISIDNLTRVAAFELVKRVTRAADLLNKNVSIALLDASGNIIILVRGEGVGPHNTEAARRKAFTALSTKTPTLLLLRNAEKNPDSKNLNTLPELVLLSGGSPIWYKGNVIGSVGVAGGGNAENDDLLAKAATIPEQGITTIK